MLCAVSYMVLYISFTGVHSATECYGPTDKATERSGWGYSALVLPALRSILYAPEHCASPLMSCFRRKQPIA